jgi:F-type H+-transporting ATPase subunit b
MLINWFTVGSQALNFVILVWLMKHFLYKPVLSAIDAREKKITDEIADAKNQKNAAKKESDEFKKKNTDFDQQRTNLFSQAVEKAKVESDRLLQMAHQTADNLRAKRQVALQDEQKSLLTELNQKAQAQIFAIARKALKDLANVSLEERIVEAFLRRISDPKINEAQALKGKIDLNSGPLIIRTAFELTAAQKTAIEKALKEFLGPSQTLQFKTAPNLVSGIECNVNGRKIAWSIHDYLAALEKNLAEVLKSPSQPQARAAQVPNADLVAATVEKTP